MGFGEQKRLGPSMCKWTETLNVIQNFFSPKLQNNRLARIADRFIS
jgi:hypothetical protein